MMLRYVNDVFYFFFKKKILTEIPCIISKTMFGWREDGRKGKRGREGRPILCLVGKRFVWLERRWKEREEGEGKEDQSFVWLGRGLRERKENEGNEFPLAHHFSSLPNWKEMGRPLFPFFYLLQTKHNSFISLSFLLFPPLPFYKT